MNNNLSTIYIAYSCNEAYIHHTGISMISLFESNKNIDSIIIYFIQKDVGPDSIEILKQICESYNRKLEVVSFYDLCIGLDTNNTGRHIETVYSKIFLPRIPGLNKCLYIDSDTIIVDSLQELWSTDVSGLYLAAVETLSANNKKELGINKHHIFFNDGVVLMNVEFCRENNLIDKAIHIISKFSGNPPVLSEGVLNVVCEDLVKIISMKYNLMSGMYQLAKENSNYLSSITSYSKKSINVAYNNPVIIHYLSAYYNRPWSKRCTHPLKQNYLHYKSISPWKDLKLTDENLSRRLKFLNILGLVMGFTTLHRLSRIKQQIQN